jgi:hypothetical protein
MAQVLSRHQVHYFRCDYCGFIQTEPPYWLDDAYAAAITKSDLGLVGRNVVFSAVCKALISHFFDATARFADYGGGYGLFVRLMRDEGYDFYRYDKYCDNLFAEGLDALRPDLPSYELVTALEVFEHLVNPLEEIGHMLQFSRNIFFTTELVPPNNPRPNEWPYYGLEHGQHVSLYTARTLKTIAEHFNLRLYTNGTSLHLLTDHTINKALFRLILHRKAARLLNLFFRRKSLLPADVMRVMQKLNASGRPEPTQRQA